MNKSYVIKQKGNPNKLIISDNKDSLCKSGVVGYDLTEIVNKINKDNLQLAFKDLSQGEIEYLIDKVSIAITSRDSIIEFINYFTDVATSYINSILDILSKVEIEEYKES